MALFECFASWLDRGRSKSWLSRLRSWTWFTASVVACATFTESFLYQVVTPVFPYSFIDRVGMESDDVQQWVDIVFTTDAMGLFVGALVFGHMSDKLQKRKIPLLIGSAVLIGAHSIMVFLNNRYLLALGRFLQGVSAGGVWCIGLALIADIADPDKVGRMMGFVTGANSMAGLAAPLLGGFVYMKAGYFPVFYIGWCLICLDLVLRSLLFEKETSPIVAFEAQSFHPDHGQTESGQDHFTRQPALLIQRSKTLSETSGAQIVTKEVKAAYSTSSLSGESSAMIGLLKKGRVWAACAANIVIAAIFTGFDVTLPLFAKDAYHWESDSSGYLYAALLAPALCQYLYGKIIDRCGSKWPAVIGLSITITPLVCLRFVAQNTTRHKVLLCVLLFLISTGLSLSLAAFMTEFTTIVRDRERDEPGSMGGESSAFAQSYSFFNMSWAVGTIMGSQFAGEIHKHYGWDAVGWGFAIMVGIILIPTVTWVGGKVSQSWHIRRASGYESGSSSQQIITPV